MAGRIQDITVENGGDTTKLQTALKGVNLSELHSGDPVIPGTEGKWACGR